MAFNRGFWDGAFVKHHRTGSHGEHVVPIFVREENEILEEEYDDDFDNEVPYDELKRLGNGSGSYLVSVMVAGGGAVVYDYIVSVDETSPERYNEAVRAYGIPPSSLPSDGSTPDLYSILALIIADQLGVPVSKLGPENLPPFSAAIVSAAVREVQQQA